MNTFTKKIKNNFIYFLTLVNCCIFPSSAHLAKRESMLLDHCTKQNRNQPKTLFLTEHTQTNIKKSQHEADYRLAILVPYRERFEELLTFAPYIHNFLNDQHIQHGIFILNQIDEYRFNRASLINVGFLYTRQDYDYIAMHDVDLLPLNKNLRYSYPKKQPFHIAAPNLHPRYHYEKFVGGILLVNREQFALVDGMSNQYWGWGLEDDEFFVRLREANLNITRPTNIKTNTSNTFKHIHDKHRRKRDTVKCFDQRKVTRRRDRQTGLHNVNYTLVSVKSMTIEGAPLTVLNIELKCNLKDAPWCDCSPKNYWFLSLKNQKILFKKIDRHPKSTYAKEGRQASAT